MTDPVAKVLRAHTRALKVYLELVELNAMTGQDTALTRCAAEYVSRVQFLEDIRHIFEDEPCES